MRRVFQFGDWVLNPNENALLRSGKGVALAPKALELLNVLVENAGRLLEKEEILKRVWPDQYVEESNLAVHVSALRKALGESPDGVPYIETVPRKGYRFNAAVHVRENSRARRARPALLLLGALALLVLLVFNGLRRPAPVKVRTLAVLPFTTLNPAPSDADRSLGLAIADALIVNLARSEHLLIRPTSSIRAYQNSHPDPVECGRRLQVDAVLDGSFQRDEDRIRVTVQLLSVATGRHLWTSQFEERSSDLFLLEDRIARQVSLSLAARITQLGSPRPDMGDTPRFLARYFGRPLRLKP